MKNSLKGLASFIVISAIILLAVVANPGKRHGHPSPTPTPTPVPIPSPAPSPPHVTLAWDASADSTVIGYALWMGFSSGTETQQGMLGNVLTCTVTLSSGTTYFFYVTAYDSQLTQSLPSNEVSYTTP